jgi:hypothetical protein
MVQFVFYYKIFNPLKVLQQSHICTRISTGTRNANFPNNKKSSLFTNSQSDMKYSAEKCTVGAESLCRAESFCRNTCISYFRHLELR